MEAMNTDWSGEQTSAVTVEELDALVKTYLEKREVYEQAKKVSGEKYAEYQELENKLVQTLTLANKKSYKVDGVGLATRVQKSVVTTPKDLDSKAALYAYIREHYGNEVLQDMISINHQKLNSFYNQEAEKNEANPLFHIPGLEAPTMVESLSFRRERV